MMKGFVSVTKMLGLATLAIGLMVAGCAGPGDDTVDQANKLVGHGAFTIPVNVDPANMDITFGDGAESGMGVFNGHTVEVIDTGCSGTGLPGDQVACTVRVINRAPGYYMTNATLYLSFCADCVASQNWANADCTGSPCIRPCGPDGAALTGGDNGCATPWPAGVNNGYVIVEDGDFSAALPYTVKGGYNHEVPGPLYKPNQVLGHNDYQDIVWNFATADGTHFTLYANVTATWQPMDPTADARNNANDWYNRSVMMYMIGALDDAGTDPKGNWNVGTYRHSTVLAGYGAGTNEVSLPAGSYFAVNAAVDYPDRIENENPGWVGGAFSDYEYGTLYAGIIHFNPAIVSPVTADAPINGAGLTYVYFGGYPHCANGRCLGDGTTGTQRRLYDSITQLENMSVMNSQTSFADKGYAYFFPLINAVSFSWNTAAAAGNPWRYYSAGGKLACTRTASIFPVHAGHFGSTRVNPAALNATCVLVATQAAALLNEAADPGPDMPLGIFYFKVQPVAGGVSPSGLGTMFYTDSHGSNFTYKYAHTAHTQAGGNASGSDDWNNYCDPFDMGFNNATDQGCPAGKIFAIPDVDWVFRGQEQSNSKISQSGYVVPGGGTYIGWPVGVTVQ